MIVRRAEVSDAPQLAEAHVRSMQATYVDLVPQATLDNLSVEDNEVRTRQHLTEGITQTFVTEAVGEVIVFAVLGNTTEEDEDGLVGQLYAIYVDPAWWRQGAGRLLWDKAVKCARRTGWAKLLANVVTGNTHACRFYEAMGCVTDPRSVKTGEYLGATVETVTYQLKLKP